MKTKLTILILVSLILSCAPYQPYGAPTTSSSQTTQRTQQSQQQQQPSVDPSALQELTRSIRSVSDYMNNNIPRGNLIVILNVQSESASLSQFVFDDLEQNAVNDRIFTVVDRHALDRIRAEQNLQLSGDVDDSTALDIGRFLGAQTIVMGRINAFGGHYRLNIRALDVQTAQVQGQYNQNLGSESTINAMLRGGGSTTTAQTTSGTTTPRTQTQNQAQATTQQTQAQPLTQGIMVPGATLTEKIAWLRRSADSHGTYILEVTQNERIAPTTFHFSGTVNIKIALRGDDQERLIGLTTNGAMFTVRQHVTLILERNIVLVGHDNNTEPIIHVNGGELKMHDGARITGNHRRRGNGGGVSISSGSFEMLGGQINGNSAENGGGVYIAEHGSFVMRDGLISSNRAVEGGGIYLYIWRSVLNIRGGQIFSNVASRNGGGVRIRRSGSAHINFQIRGTVITGSDHEQGNRVADEDGNLIARRGHAIYVTDSLRKERTLNARDNIENNTGAWDR
jgi:hypothetical protein